MRQKLFAYLEASQFHLNLRSFKEHKILNNNDHLPFISPAKKICPGLNSVTKFTKFCKSATKICQNNKNYEILQGFDERGRRNVNEVKEGPQQNSENKTLWEYTLRCRDCGLIKLI